MNFSISAWVSSRVPIYQPRTQTETGMDQGMIVGMILKGYILIFLSYTSDKLLYEANIKMK
jgi:hypothetical protein